MSFKSIDRKNNIIISNPINFDKIIIPFSEFGETKVISDLYHGTEKIPFTKRDPHYQEILKNEFAEGFLFEIHKHIIKINYILTRLSD